MREDVEAARTSILHAVAFNLLLVVHRRLQVQKCRHDCLSDELLLRPFLFSGKVSLDITDRATQDKALLRAVGVAKLLRRRRAGGG
jgi:hypothetical protein